MSHGSQCLVACASAMIANALVKVEVLYLHEQTHFFEHKPEDEGSCHRPVPPRLAIYRYYDTVQALSSSLGVHAQHLAYDVEEPPIEVIVLCHAGDDFLVVAVVLFQIASAWIVEAAGVEMQVRLWPARPPDILDPVSHNLDR